MPRAFASPVGLLIYTYSETSIISPALRPVKMVFFIYVVFIYSGYKTDFTLEAINCGLNIKVVLIVRWS